MTAERADFSEVFLDEDSVSGVFKSRFMDGGSQIIISWQLSSH